MDFDQYVAARYGRLIEHAVLLGCAEGEAGTCVDQVLLEQRKRSAAPRIPTRSCAKRWRERSTAPPSGRAAPARWWPSARGHRGGGGRRADLPATAAAGALAVRPRREPGPAAARGPGYDVLLRPARSCEPEGLVLGPTRRRARGSSRAPR